MHAETKFWYLDFVIAGDFYFVFAFVCIFQIVCIINCYYFCNKNIIRNKLRQPLQ